MTPRTGVSRPRVLIVGGSLSGLLAGNLFHRLGWDVAVFERTAGVLEGRGAGITILPGLVEPFRAAGVNATEESLGVMLPARIALDAAGRIVAQRDFPQGMTSWGRLYEALKSAFPAERYHAGMSVERIEQSTDTVTAHFAGDGRAEGDLLIGADGLRSTVRAQCLPEIKPFYPGYIAWRCLAEESALSAATHATLFDRYAVCVAPGQQGIGYAVPGRDHATQPGRRQYNVVWYRPVPEHDLPGLMTDAAGRRHLNGISPSLIRSEVREEMVETAQQVLAPQFAEAIRRASLHFFQPIVDLESPRTVFGRVVIVGDAAFVARPHVAMGVPKGAGDVIDLVEALRHGGADLSGGLQAYEQRRLRLGNAIVARGKYLGAYMEAQLKSDEERRRAQAARIPEQVMMETAAPVNYEQCLDGANPTRA
ncbi:MAG TPA: FAD-dependent monooxygenase [Burkholderiales bacterium]|nr:FAD-dependent monooxygenase [Burkholderiales bacterium]